MVLVPSGQKGNIPAPGRPSGYKLSNPSTQKANYTWRIGNRILSGTLLPRKERTELVKSNEAQELSNQGPGNLDIAMVTAVSLSSGIEELGIETKKEIYKQLKAGISYEDASGYSITTLKELLSDLQPPNYKWLTYTCAAGGSWSATINGQHWGTGLTPTEPGGDEAYTQTVVELSGAIQVAEQTKMLIDPYTSEAVEGLILQVSEAISAAAKIPYMLKDLIQPMPLGIVAGAAVLNNNINITVINEALDDLTIVLFQQDQNINGMFDKIFPAAWKVFPLKGKRSGVTSTGRTIYPVQQGIGVSRQSNPNDSLPYGNLEVTRDVTSKEKLEFTIDSNKALDLQPLSEKNADETVSCVNHSQERADIALYKNGSVVVVQQKVAANDEAKFLLTPKLYAMWGSSFKEGKIFKSYVSSPEVKEIDLTGATNITLKVVPDPSGGAGAKMWDLTIS